MNCTPKAGVTGSNPVGRAIFIRVYSGHMVYTLMHLGRIPACLVIVGSPVAGIHLKLGYIRETDIQAFGCYDLSH